MRASKGFTLIEVLVAVVMASFVALVAVSALRATTTARDQVQSITDMRDELRFTAQALRTDLTNLYRDPERKQMKIECLIDEVLGKTFSSLTIRSVSRQKVRFDTPESDVYETQYSVMEGTDGAVLTRRREPIVGHEEPDELGGGVLTALSDTIYAFEVRLYDGDMWVYEWTEDTPGFPQMMEVTLVLGRAEEGEKPELATTNFIINIPRLPAAKASAATQTPENNANSQPQSR